MEAFKSTICCFRRCPASSMTSSSRPPRCDGSWRMALAKCCKSVAYVYTHMHNIARPRAPSRLPYLGVYVTCLISPCWLWAADTWLGAAGLTAGRGGGYIGSDRPAVPRCARHLACSSLLAVRASMPGEPKVLQPTSYLEYGTRSLRGRPQQPPPRHQGCPLGSVPTHD